MQEALEEISGKKNRGESMLPTALPGESLAIKTVIQKSISPVTVAPQPQGAVQQTGLVPPALPLQHLNPNSCKLACIE